jgi:hypothetical protein
MYVCVSKTVNGIGLRHPNELQNIAGGFESYTMEYILSGP